MQKLGSSTGRPEVHRQIALATRALAADDAPAAQIRPTHHSRSLSANMPPHASFVGAELSITLARHSAGVAAFPRRVRERIPRLSYRSIRGSPKCGKTLLSPNQEIADIPSPSSVRTNNAYGRVMSVWGTGR
jgi:hypothetical protein